MRNVEERSSVPCVRFVLVAASGGVDDYSLWAVIWTLRFGLGHSDVHGGWEAESGKPFDHASGVFTDLMVGEWSRADHAFQGTGPAFGIAYGRKVRVVAVGPTTRRTWGRLHRSSFFLYEEDIGRRGADLDEAHD